MFTPALKPLVRIALTFAIVWFYQGLTSSFVSGWAQLLVVIVLAIPTWIVVTRALFPSEGDGLFDEFRGKRE